MIKKLLNGIINRLYALDAPNDLKYVGLWNQNVSFAEQERPWAMPAVFVEFLPIEWQVMKNAAYKANPQIRLHIVTEWDGMDEIGCLMRSLDLQEEILFALQGLSGAMFGGIYRLSTEMNHDHEEIIDTIDTYTCTLHDEFVLERLKELGKKNKE